MAVHRLAATTPPLGKILTADEIARFVARVGYPAGPVVLVGEELALAASAGAYGGWLGALGLPDLAEKDRTLLPESTVVSTMAVPRGRDRHRQQYMQGFWWSVYSAIWGTAAGVFGSAVRRGWAARISTSDSSSPVTLTAISVP